MKVVSGTADIGLVMKAEPAFGICFNHKGEAENIHKCVSLIHIKCMWNIVCKTKIATMAMVRNVEAISENVEAYATIENIYLNSGFLRENEIK
jgi:hypothetical protein